MALSRVGTTRALYSRLFKVVEWVVSGCDEQETCMAGRGGRVNSTWNRFVVSSVRSVRDGCVKTLCVPELSLPRTIPL